MLAIYFNTIFRQGHLFEVLGYNYSKIDKDKKDLKKGYVESTITFHAR